MSEGLRGFQKLGRPFGGGPKNEVTIGGTIPVPYFGKLPTGDDLRVFKGDPKGQRTQIIGF